MRGCFGEMGNGCINIGRGGYDEDGPEGSSDNKEEDDSAMESIIDEL